MQKYSLHAFALTAVALTFLSRPALGQTQTTGRIVGTVRDSQGALVPGAQIEAENISIGELRKAATDGNGSYIFPSLAPGVYTVTIRAAGFAPVRYENIRVWLGGVLTLDATIPLAHGIYEVTAHDTPPTILADTPAMGVNLDSHTVSSLPLPTRNFVQLAALAPGVSIPLINNTTIGRNSPNFSVNGARVSQNNFRINGVDANYVGGHDSANVAVPAPRACAKSGWRPLPTTRRKRRVVGGMFRWLPRAGPTTFMGISTNTSAIMLLTPTTRT